VGLLTLRDVEYADLSLPDPDYDNPARINWALNADHIIGMSAGTERDLLEDQLLWTGIALSTGKTIAVKVPFDELLKQVDRALAQVWVTDAEVGEP
jgi:hypothetical protein